VVKYSWKGAGYYSWVVGAQVHYSFLQNLENDELWRYKFDLWDYHHDRISINFICVWGDDIVANRPFTGNDDEKFLTILLTKKLGRRKCPALPLSSRIATCAKYEESFESLTVIYRRCPGWNWSSGALWISQASCRTG
jgi:hypothetical protein